MYFISTRDKNSRKTLSEAIRDGLAEDGGLYMPESIPSIDISQYSDELSYPLFAEKLLHKFFKDDILDKKLLNICKNAFTFPAPLKQLNHNTFILELFHGPTSSFKDFGARFLAECLNEISDKQKTTIMVATSGDTGSAVASAFYLKPNINVIILYPKGKVSKRQEHQITCWDHNILSLMVNGTFDDCQRLVKAAFQDAWWKKHLHVSSANSINIGRLLPQIVYYAYSSMQFYHQYKEVPGYIVPTGNLGNAIAGYLAKIMGFPIREIVLATNSNRVILDYLESGKYHSRPSIATLANAMDVGNPSNFERLQHLFKNFELLKKNVHAFSANDEDIKNTIKAVYQNEKTIICPHTATAYFAREKLSDQSWIVVATADPCKFENIVEPLVHMNVPIASELQTLLERPTHLIEVKNELADIQSHLPKSWYEKE